MSIIRERFKLSTLSLAVLSSMSMQALAFEEESNKDENVEVIEVEGFRGSLIKSINDKRFSNNIADTINAEDVGKNTDQNIADALGRITGVSIVSNRGEGSQISIRGSSSQQNSVTLNGQQLASTDFSQAVDLSSFSADILSRLEVVKTPSADHDEGSLGGTVNLVTIKPLDRDPIRTGEIQGRYNEFADETDGKIQFTVTEKFFDDTFGVALTAYKDTNTSRRDQYRVANFVESNLFREASDQNGNVVSDVIGIKHSSTGYSLNLDDSERTGITLGLQWLPTDVTEVMFDVTYSEQERVRTFDEIKTRSTGSTGLVEGQLDVANYTTEEWRSTFTDPFADWLTIDTTTNTITKETARFGVGDISRSNIGSDESNLSTTLKVDHYITDDIKMSVALGHSKSETENTPDSAFTNMQNFNQVPGPTLFNAGTNIVPSGYDCTSGECRIVTGEGFVDLGANNSAYEDENGIQRAQWYDNTVTTGFNPADLNTFHLGFIQRNSVRVEDEINNAQVDFDWDVELGPVTQLEFGAKFSQREKFVDNQAFQFTSTSQTIVLEDPITGQLNVIDNGALAGITANLIARPEGLQYDDFMQSLGYGRNSVTTGLRPINIKNTLDLILGDDDVALDINDTETRSTDIDTKAVYFKANFELLDGALTGDLGLRYVETEVLARGFAGAQWWSHTGTNLAREFDYIKLQELRDTSLPACDIKDPSDNGYAKKFGRVDGLGWDTSAGPDPSTWTRIPDQGACHDTDYAEWFEILQSDPDATVYPDSYSRAGEDIIAPNWVNMWRYADISGTHYDEFGDPSLTSAPFTWDGFSSSTSDTVGYVANSVANNRVTSFASIGDNEYSNVLPSLNLNYAISDELVARFAISKTMTRPEIDSLRPGFSLNQNAYWAGEDSNVGSRITQFNTKLKPLESENLDLSIEWYFNPTSMLSIAFFKKDMSNLEDRNSFLSYVRDFRNDEVLNVDTLYIEDANTSNETCLGLRGTADFPFNKNLAPTLTDDKNLLCDTYNVSQIVNKKSATTKGIELGYSQTYDFLPGFLSGLGISANYTFQESEQEAEFTDEGVALPLYPVADTPKHSYNLTTFWEQNGHQLRLSYRGSSDSLVGIDWNTGFRGREWNQGSIWNEGRDSLDLAASYKVNDNITLSFQAVNLTDEEFRTYFTSRTLGVERLADGSYGEYLEGNPIEGEATKSRTYTRFKVGTTYRLGLRVNF